MTNLLIENTELICGIVGAVIVLVLAYLASRYVKHYEDI